MIARLLDRWLLDGVIGADEIPRLEPTFVSDGDEDVIMAASLAIRDLGVQLEALRVQTEKRRAVEPAAPAQVSSDLEIRNHAKAVLPALDALDRVVEFGDEHARQNETLENWLLSVKGMRTRLAKVMESIGLTAFNSIGCEVDLERHDVVSVVAAGQNPPNTVVAEKQRGYLFRGKMLRDAKVVVAQ